MFFDPPVKNLSLSQLRCQLPLERGANKNPRLSVKENRGREVYRRPLIFNMGEGRKMCRNCRRSSSFTLL